MTVGTLAERVRNRAGRDAFGEALQLIGRENDAVVVVGADDISSLRGNAFAAEFPDRAFNVGIAEANASGVAAGLALGGKIPLVLLYGFTVLRAAEQIRDDVCYPNLNVKVVTTSSGLVMGEGGVTHHCTEDLAVTRSLANMTIVQPASALETAIVTKAVVERLKGPTFLRIARCRYEDRAEQALQDYYLGGGAFEVGKAVTLREGDDITLIASGLMLSIALHAADLLAESGVSARVMNMHTIKPLDSAAVIDGVTQTRGIVTLEDHNVLGGIGEAVCGVVSETRPIPVRRIGVRDTYCAIGPMDELFEKYGLTAEATVEAAKEILAGGSRGSR